MLCSRKTGLKGSLCDGVVHFCGWLLFLFQKEQDGGKGESLERRTSFVVHEVYLFRSLLKEI